MIARPPPRRPGLASASPFGAAAGPRPRPPRGRGAFPANGPQRLRGLLMSGASPALVFRPDSGSGRASQDTSVGRGGEYPPPAAENRGQFVDRTAHRQQVAETEPVQTAARPKEISAMVRNMDESASESAGKGPEGPASTILTQAQREFARLLGRLLAERWREEQGDNDNREGRKL
jgi:hypothetical protein